MLFKILFFVKSVYFNKEIQFYSHKKWGPFGGFLDVPENVSSQRNKLSSKFFFSVKLQHSMVQSFHTVLDINMTINFAITPYSLDSHNMVIKFEPPHKRDRAKRGSITVEGSGAHSRAPRAFLLSYGRLYCFCDNKYLF